MPRPKGSKKDKNQSSSPLPLLYSNDDINWLETSINNPLVNKGGRPKKTEFINANLIPINSSSEINGRRVVINPAVLRYLEQNRNLSITNKNDEFFDKNISMEGKDDHAFDDLLKSFAVQESTILSNERMISINEFIEFDKLIEDDLLWDFCTCSTEFLTTARLAEWILTHQQSAKLETMSL